MFKDLPHNTRAMLIFEPFFSVSRIAGLAGYCVITDSDRARKPAQC